MDIHVFCSLHCDQLKLTFNHLYFLFLKAMVSLVTQVVTQMRLEFGKDTLTSEV